MTIDAMKQALKALEMLARYENPETKIQVRKPKDAGPIVTMYPHKVATDAADVLRTAIAEAEKQEPVAWYDSISGWTDFTFYKPHRKPSSPSAKWIPLYTTPPAAQQGMTIDASAPIVMTPHPAFAKRQWVGLTNKDIIEMWPETSTVGWDDIRLIEAKLKEKNHVAVD